MNIKIKKNQLGFEFEITLKTALILFIVTAALGLLK
jgi:hypothetical protein